MRFKLKTLLGWLGLNAAVLGVLFIDWQPRDAYVLAAIAFVVVYVVPWALGVTAVVAIGLGWPRIALLSAGALGAMGGLLAGFLLYDACARLFPGDYQHSFWKGRHWAPDISGAAYLELLVQLLCVNIVAAGCARLAWRLAEKRRQKSG